VCLNPKDIPPDDLDDVIRGRMIKEAGMFYRMAKRRNRKIFPLFNYFELNLIRMDR